MRRHIEGLEASTKARFEAAPQGGKARRFKEFLHGAKSWGRVERIIARVEVGAEGPDTRFIVTNLTTRNARVLYECQSASNSFQVTASKSFQLLRPLSAVSGAV